VRWAIVLHSLCSSHFAAIAMQAWPVCRASDRIRAAAIRDVADMVASQRPTFPPDGSPKCGDLLVKEVTFVVDELLCMDAIEVGRSMRQATIMLFRALCNGVDSGIKQAAQQNKGYLPKILVNDSEAIMRSLSHVMEYKLTRATVAYTTRLGVLCVRGKMEPALHNVASALGVEAV
jgi:hypothetical protein